MEDLSRCTANQSRGDGWSRKRTYRSLRTCTNQYGQDGIQWAHYAHGYSSCQCYGGYRICEHGLDMYCGSGRVRHQLCVFRQVAVAGTVSCDYHPYRGYDTGRWPRTGRSCGGLGWWRSGCRGGSLDGGWCGNSSVWISRFHQSGDRCLRYVRRSGGRSSLCVHYGFGLSSAGNRSISRCARPATEGYGDRTASWIDRQSAGRLTMHDRRLVRQALSAKQPCWHIFYQLCPGTLPRRAQCIFDLQYCARARLPSRVWIVRRIGQQAGVAVCEPRTTT